MKLRHLFLFLLAPLALFGQEYRLKQFRVEDGLPSNVIKAITQDSSGFFWIATDEGLVKFDGIRFTSYKGAMHSQYSKGFLNTRSGKLYVYGDLDLIEIVNEIDTVIFKSVLRGTRNPTDSTLWFPKAMYEDRFNDLWLAEPQSVARLRNGILTRFNFDIDDRSPQFLRSFTFFEDRPGSFFVISYSGNVYRLDPDRSSFVKQPVKFPKAVNDVRSIDNVLWIASEEGVHTSNLLQEGGFTAPMVRTTSVNASHLLLLDKPEMLVSTFDQEHYFTDISKGGWQKLPFRINGVNSSYRSTENDLWMASNEGVILLQKNLFDTVETPEATFEESITEDRARHILYHCTMHNLYRVYTEGGSEFKSEKMLSIPGGYFQSLAVDYRGLWAANAFSVYMINNDKITRKWDFESEGRFIHDIVLDEAGNLWLSQAGNNNVICITPSFVEKRYPIPLKPEGIVSCVRDSPKGIYVASNGNTGYLFYKSNADSSFRNVSVPIDFKTHGDFNVTDLVVTDSLVWMATSEGVVRFNGKSLTKLDLGDVFSGIPVKTINVLQAKYLVFNNSFGLFTYDINSGDYWRYDDSNGLPSNTITSRGIYVDHHHRVWVGTSVGLAVSSMALMSDKVTAKPHITSTRINGVEKRFAKNLQIPFGSYFTVNMSCISFPAEKIQMQYRITGLDSTWRTVQANELTLTDLASGTYCLETRAKKNGGYVWSELSFLDFQVNKPFWQQTWFAASIIMLVGFIAWSSFALAAYFNRKRRMQLEALVNQRTIELKRINDELSMRNSELDRFVYSTSHDLSAPLKSIRGLIMVAKMEQPTESQLGYLQMMDKSVKKLEAFIADVINYSRNTRAAVQHAPVDFKLFIQQVLDDHQYAPNYGKIKFIVEDTTSSVLMSDEMRLKIIFNNLISNAIKFHFIGDGKQPFVKITACEEDSFFRFTVEDNGTGIQPHLKDRIFDMFFRATDSVPGSGLGLYILRETVNKLGGEVQVTTEVGSGTTFVIILPKNNNHVLKDLAGN
ncbi:MAG TPA: ATP-binding protein [Cyclobacteriaceae bacterium]|nr:ATP-binding protein [Cyclobacteriaceae bacterium]